MSTVSSSVHGRLLAVYGWDSGFIMYRIMSGYMRYMHDVSIIS